MAEALASTSSEDGLPLQWKLSNQRSRKSGCSNIFTGLNLHQLHRLFRTAGDRDAEHRAKLVWRGMDADIEGAQEAKEEEAEDSMEEAGLAQALVGLRVRARNKSGIRAEGHRDHKGLRASGYLKIEESLTGYPVEDEEADIGPSSGEFRSATEEDISENQNPFKPSSRRLSVAGHEGVNHSERYLHRIIH
ncbi:arginine vasopressin-induced protein 1 [Etheostoma cragini]|uniref:arginine vasopressin-induced protein 1 n=1 Tax=Etheostoma cragini TaxID=417921 RepID=UPI00155E4371|nr:arginine vasopressin-induced protein 1 [Etheostoma cragini]